MYYADRPTRLPKPGLGDTTPATTTSSLSQIWTTLQQPAFMLGTTPVPWYWLIGGGVAAFLLLGGHRR